MVDATVSGGDGSDDDGNNEEAVVVGGEENAITRINHARECLIRT
jgi:3-hydroxyisobutyrate dehydrogenase-like beta-hydroxyacid dehydrogenase